jgi:hypothetical protein
MKKVFLSSFAVVIAVLAVASANAAIVFTQDPNATRTVSGGNATYTLSFSATAPGGVVAGFAGNFAGNNGFNGANPNGPLGQQLAGGALPTPTSGFNALIDESLDSQFLIVDADILSAVAPFESTTTLGGAFTLNVASRAVTKALVQIVAPANAFVPYDFGISEAVGAGSETFNFVGILGIPEPTTFGLAGLSLLGLVAARRRVA